MDTAILFFAAIGVLFTIAAIVFAVLSWRGRGITGILEDELNEARQANAYLRERLVTERLAKQLEDARQMSENTTMEVELGLSIEEMESLEKLEAQLAECREKLAVARARCIDALSELEDSKTAHNNEVVQAVENTERLLQAALARERLALEHLGRLANLHVNVNEPGTLERLRDAQNRALFAVGHPRHRTLDDTALNAALEQARAEERERARLLFDAVKQAMDEEYELSERTCDALWEAWCAYGEELR